ncbi:HipA family kinase [Phyllobacterium bourgognense]|nr:HipA family kinase [Phyllobacterium bourgognense]
MAIEIQEVLRRSEQGITEPYICRGTDTKLYYVKGKGAGYDSLVKEWVAGQLARRLGLPIPTFHVVVVPRELYEIGRKESLRDLGHGSLFGSEQVMNVNELSVLNSDAIPAELKREIVAFDWWVMNGDRTLTEAGGNPNILWSETNSQPFIIDHNLAFDTGVTLRSLLESHIFAGSLKEICESSGLQAHYKAKFQNALTNWQNIVSDIPERWYYEDDALSVQSRISIDSIEVTLQRYQAQAFWKQT